MAAVRCSGGRQGTVMRTAGPGSKLTYKRFARKDFLDDAIVGGKSDPGAWRRRIELCGRAIAVIAPEQELPATHNAVNLCMALLRPEITAISCSSVAVPAM